MNISFYQKRLSLPNATFSVIEHADAMVAFVYKVSQPNAILKICTHPNHYLREVYFLNHFKNALPVPKILDLVQPSENAPGAILMEYLPGVLLSETSFTDKLAFEMGSLLARIHLSPAKGYGDIIFPDELSADPKNHFSFKFEEGLLECKGHLPDDLLQKCKKYFDSHIHLLDAADGPCLVHRDFRAGNVIVQENEIMGVIDWASGRAGFAQEDFCPMEHGEWPSNPKTKASFAAGYASIRPIPPYDEMLPLLRLSKAIATLGFISKTGTTNKHKNLYQHNLQFLNDSF